MAIKTLEEKFTTELNGIYDAEHQFLEAQETMLESATAPTVQKMLERHIAETQQQIVNLTKVHELLGLTATRKKCAGAAGLVTEGNEMLSQTADVPALADLAIAGSCSKVEHFEIATYRGLIAGAQTMGETEVARLLTENLNQEENTAKALESNLPPLLEKAFQTASNSAAG